MGTPSERLNDAEPGAGLKGLGACYQHAEGVLVHLNEVELLIVLHPGIPLGHRLLGGVKDRIPSVSSRPAGA